LTREAFSPPSEAASVLPADGGATSSPAPTPLSDWRDDLAASLAERRPWLRAEIEAGAATPVFRLLALKARRHLGRRFSRSDPRAFFPGAMVAQRLDVRQAMTLAWEAGLSERETLLGFAAAKAIGPSDLSGFAPSSVQAGGRRASLKLAWMAALAAATALLFLSFLLVADGIPHNAAWRAAQIRGDWASLARASLGVAARLAIIAPASAAVAVFWAWGTVRLLRKPASRRLYVGRAMAPLVSFDGLASMASFLWPLLRLFGPALAAFWAVSAKGLLLLESRYLPFYGKLWEGWLAAGLAAEMAGVFAASWAAGLALFLLLGASPESLIAQGESAIRAWRARRFGV
jgi:hypothetical protein